jgi:hypothetical protein
LRADAEVARLTAADLLAKAEAAKVSADERWATAEVAARRNTIGRRKLPAPQTSPAINSE